ncbi:MAG: hypothetical protein LC778_09865, partial [Acidobacteria bacterium]|nr:hypothetical protein [Acidobacteriota bacterium]
VLINFNSDQVVSDIIQNAEPEKISSESGLPLSRVEWGLQLLTVQSEEKRFSKPHSKQSKAAISTAEQVFEYALLLARQSKCESAAKSQLPLKDAQGNVKVDLRDTSEVVENAVLIRVEAERLINVGKTKPVQKSKQQQTMRLPNEEQIYLAQKLAERLRRAADKLLQTAEFVAITNVQKRILYGNAAFLSLLEPTDKLHDRGSPQKRERVRLKNQKLWEKALANAKTGTQELADPLKGNAIWQLQRIKVQDVASEDVQAYVNTLRWRDVILFAPEVLAEISEILPQLTNYACFLSPNTPNENDEYLSQIGNLTESLERLTAIEKS